MVPAKEAACQQRCLPQIWAQTAYSHLRNILVDVGVMACLGLDVAFGVFRAMGLPLGIALGHFGLGRFAIQASRAYSFAAIVGFAESPAEDRMGYVCYSAFQSKVVDC